MHPSPPSKSPQAPLLAASSSSSSSAPQHPHPLSPSFALTRRAKSLLQLAVAASLVTASLVLLRNADSRPAVAAVLPDRVASVLLPAANALHRAPTAPALAVAPDHARGPAKEAAAGDADFPFTGYREDGGGRLQEHTTVLKPLARTKAVSYDEPWVYSKDPAELPPCERILLFQFMPWWGFASEYILYARAAAAADKLGYTFLEDDRNWNYGRLRNYFRPRTLSCVPPADWTDPRLAAPLSFASVRERPARLVYSRLHLSNLDDWTREVYLSTPATQAALRALRDADEAHAKEGDRWLLEEGGSLPAPLERVFDDQRRAVRGMWALNKEVEAQVREVKRRSGLGRRRWITGEEDAQGGAEERRGPVIALHVRLGDKAAEYEHDSREMGITNSFGNLTVYVEAAHDAYRRLLPSRYPSLSPTSAPRFSPYARPSLLLVTAEPSIPALLRSSTPLSRPFELVQTPEPAVRAPETKDEARARLAKQAAAGAGAGSARGKGRAKAGGPKAYGGAKGAKGVPKVVRRAAEADAPPPDLSAGYTQAAFNALPLLERVVHTQAFVRDLTVLAREADAAVVSGASNVGRLAMLIAGKDAVTGPRDAHGKGLGGRIRSVDAHFYPTAYTTAVYESVADVEDLDNAAFLPQEQHEAEQAAIAAQAERKKRRRRGKERRRRT
ncbi:hypothetical protein JCM10450v2_007959 [Rhodotorula kratochvilovae]